jgi:Zn-dependent peptidase ImmA (M78 family)
VPELRAVRFRSFKRLKTREQVLADVARWLQDFNYLEDVLNEHREYPLKKFGGSRNPEGRPIAAARWARDRFNLGASDPVRDICGLLESKGIKVLTLNVASDAFFGLSVASGDGGPAIVVNTWERISVERWVFTAAHELGHLILHMAGYDVDRREEAEAEERDANIFASHFLMPEEAFQDEWADTSGMSLVDRVLKIKRMFRVSFKTILYRVSAIRPQTGNLWLSFQLEYKRTFGKTLMKSDEPKAMASDAFRASFPEASTAGEPEKLSRMDFIEDRLAALVRKAIERSAITLSRGAEILGLSHQEMRQLAASWVG